MHCLQSIIEFLYAYVTRMKAMCSRWLYAISITYSISSMAPVCFPREIKVHYFTLICAGQCTRPVYGDQGIHQATQREKCR